MNVTLAPTPGEPETQVPPKAWTFLDEHAKVLTSHSERIAVLEAKQSMFAAALTRIETTMASAMATLSDKIDKIGWWLIGALLFLSLSLLGLVIQMLWRTHP